MNKGELRDKILGDCPEEFYDQLKDWVDNLEHLMGSALDDMVMTDGIESERND